MGRYTTVHSFADNNPSLVKVQYDEAALASAKLAEQGKEGSFGAGVKVEKVNNVMGSTAGAGSGEFHMYRHTRRREIERWEGIEQRAAEDEAQAEFEARVDSKRKECEERTRKNAEKRRRKKMRKMQHAEEERAAAGAKAVGKGGESGGGDKGKKEEAPVDDDEFSYTPLHLPVSSSSSSSSSPSSSAAASSSSAAASSADSSSAAAVDESEVLKAVVANDGSFLEKMNAIIAAQKAH